MNTNSVSPINPVTDDAPSIVRPDSSGDAEHHHSEKLGRIARSALIDKEVAARLACRRPWALASRLGFYPAVLFFNYWFIPLGTWGLFVNLVRALAEHYPDSEFQWAPDFPEVFRTRDVLNTWFDQFLVATRGVNYHLTHHLIPAVPFYALPQLQRELAKSEPYRKYVHVTRGYHRFFFGIFFSEIEARRPGCC